MKLYIKTFGCQMNVHDSRRIEEIFSAAGYSMTTDPRLADVALINSCTIREKAWHKAISETGRLRKLKRRGGRSVIVGIVGCVAQQEGERIFELIPGVDMVIAPDHYGRLAELVEEVRSREDAIVMSGFDRGRPQDFLTPGLLTSRREATAFVTIMKGCQECCAYCIVPTVRGPERHRPIDDVVSEVKGLVSSGVVEVTLLGQKVNAYRSGEADFADLLRRLDSVEGLKRLRFTSPHPRHMTPDITSSFGSLRSLCESIHLPVQSGSNRILSRMGRRYNVEDYLIVVTRLRAACPSIGISTDLIVGYPGETDEDFEDTLALIDRVAFCGAFSFKYSPRPGTEAARLDDDVPAEEKVRRLDAVHERIESLERRWRESMVGSRLEILVASAGRMPGQASGRARNSQIVNFVPTDGRTIEDLVGRLVEVEVTAAHPHSLEGKPVIR